MPIPTPQELTAIGLKFSSSAKPLKVRAFSDVVVKILFLSNSPLALQIVAERVAEVVGVKKVDPLIIREALDSLLADRQVSMIENKWKLNDDFRKNVQEELRTAERSLEGVLKRNFPGHIKGTVLKSWFLESASNFLAFNATEWVDSVTRKTQAAFSKTQSTADLLRPATQKYSLGNHSKELIQSFEGFLISENIEDQTYLTNIGLAMFSSRLIAADIGADPITTEEMTDATFILDTNVLFAIQLDKSRYAKSLIALASALSHLRAHLVFLHITEEEYKRVIFAARTNVLEVVDAYQEDVVSNTHDDFIQTAQRRGFKTLSDYEIFFDQIQLPPASLAGGPQISKLDTSEVVTQVKNAEVDASLKASLRKFYRDYWPTEKSDASTAHDAGIIRVAEWMKQKDRHTWALTLDRSLHTTAAERAGAHGMPASLLLEGLIQILALSNSGPEQVATDFAPLLSSLMIHRCSPSAQTYNARDLQILYSMHEDVTTFSKERIKKVVQVVTQNRLSGKRADDPSLKLEVDRAFRHEQRQYDQELQANQARVTKAEEALLHKEETLTRVVDTAKHLQKLKLISEARWRLFWGLVWRIPVSILCSVFVFILVYWAAKGVVSNGDVLGIIASAVTLLTFVFTFLRKPLTDYRSYLQWLDIEIEKLVSETLAS